MKIESGVNTYQRVTPANSNGQSIYEKEIASKKEKKEYDEVMISKLKEKSDAAYQGLKSIVRDLLKSQGMTFKEMQLDSNRIEEAKASLEEGGYYSPEAVSERIVNFAMAISGEDPEKFDLLKSAIQEGFDAVEKAFGGKLPDISYKTYDLIMEKLDNWKNGQDNEEMGS